MLQFKFWENEKNICHNKILKLQKSYKNVLFNFIVKSEINFRQFQNEFLIEVRSLKLENEF